MRKLVLLLVMVLAFNLSNAQEQTVFKFKSTKQIVNNIYGNTIVNELNRYFIYNKDENTLYEYKTKRFVSIIQIRKLGEVWNEGDWRLKCSAVQSSNARQGESFLIKAIDDFTKKTFTIELTVTKWIEDK